MITPHRRVRRGVRRGVRRAAGLLLRFVARFCLLLVGLIEIYKDKERARQGGWCWCLNPRGSVAGRRHLLRRPIIEWEA